AEPACRAAVARRFGRAPSDAEVPLDRRGEGGARRTEQIARLGAGAAAARSAVASRAQGAFGRACQTHRRSAGMKRGLRPRLVQYGDDEFSLFLRRGFLKSAGYDDEALSRPIVGVLSTASDFNPCHGTVPKLAEAVKQGALSSGALPFVFPTISLQESFAF